MEEQTKPDGPALMDEAVEHPTLDELYRRDPRQVSDDDLTNTLVPRLREKRATFITAEDKRKAKKAGVNTDDEE